MIGITKLRKYAHSLALKGEVFGPEERVGLNILELIEHDHGADTILEKAERNRSEAARMQDTPLFTVWDQVVKKIKEG